MIVAFPERLLHKFYIIRVLHSQWQITTYKYLLLRSLAIINKNVESSRYPRIIFALVC